MAASRDTTTNHLVTDDPTFRAWGQAIHDQLIAAGLTQTSDTGQINLATVARPATSSYGGYEIFRFNDAKQATEPLFIKFEYGQASSANRPMLKCHTGTGTDGAGTLTGELTLTLAAFPASNPSGAGTVHVSYDGTVLLVFLHANNTAGGKSYGYGHAIQRLRNRDTDAVEDGWLALTWGGTFSYRAIRLRTGSQSASATVTFAEIYPGVTGVYGSDIHLGTNVHFCPDIQVLRAWIPIKKGDIAPGVTGDVEINGTTFNYRVALDEGPNTSAGVLLLNE